MLWKKWTLLLIPVNYLSWFKAAKFCQLILKKQKSNKKQKTPYNVLFSYPWAMRLTGSVNHFFPSTGLSASSTLLFSHTYLISHLLLCSKPWHHIFLFSSIFFIPNLHLLTAPWSHLFLAFQYRSGWTVIPEINKAAHLRSERPFIALCPVPVLTRPVLRQPRPPTHRPLSAFFLAHDGAF